MAHGSRRVWWPGGPLRGERCSGGKDGMNAAASSPRLRGPSSLVAHLDLCSSLQTVPITTVSFQVCFLSSNPCEPWLKLLQPPGGIPEPLGGPTNLPRSGLPFSPRHRLPSPLSFCSSSNTHSCSHLRAFALALGSGTLFTPAVSHLSSRPIVILCAALATLQ